MYNKLPRKTDIEIFTRCFGNISQQLKEQIQGRGLVLTWTVRHSCCELLQQDDPDFYQTWKPKADLCEIRSNIIQNHHKTKLNTTYKRLLKTTKCYMDIRHHPVR